MSDPVKAPTMFYVLSSILLVWNLLGVLNFVGHMTMTEEMMAAMSEEERNLYMSIPSWTYFVFGTAVFTGVLGCVGLLVKKTWSRLLLIISMIAVIFQMTYSAFMTDSVAVQGPMVWVITIVTIAISIFLVWYASFAMKKGWVS